jgi:hypothetical protein
MQSFQVMDKCTIALAGSLTCRPLLPTRFLCDSRAQATMLSGLHQPGNRPPADLVGPGEIPDRFAGCQSAASLVTLEGR